MFNIGKGLRVLACLVGVLSGSGAGAADPLEKALFEVTDRVINPDVKPFTATINGIGNGQALSPFNGGFEPRVYRTWMQTTAAAANRVIAAPPDVSGWDALREGGLDGADIEVLRLENGVFRSVRRDVVAPGGHAASGWQPVNSHAAAIAPTATTFHYIWAKWARPDAPAYFVLQAVDRAGNLGPYSNPVLVRSPQELVGVAIANATVALKAPKAGSVKQSKLNAPENLRVQSVVQGGVTLTWSAPERGFWGAKPAGYLVSMSQTPPAEHRGYFFDLAGTGPAIEQDDLVILRHRFVQGSRIRMHTDRTWNAYAPFMGHFGLKGYGDEEANGLWSLQPHAPDTPVTEPGETYLSMTYGQGEAPIIQIANNSGTAQDWYPVLDPSRTYRIEVWMRGTADAHVTFESTVYQGRAGQARFKPVPLVLTPQWTRYEIDYRMPVLYDGNVAGAMRLRFNGTGQADVDNFRIYRADTPFMELLPEDETRLKASGMASLRTHAFVKTGKDTYNLEMLTNPGGLNSAARGGNTLPQTLDSVTQVGMDLWLQVEPHFSPEEWLGLVEYLAAPFDPQVDSAANKPWAAKRVAQGRRAPWIDDLGGLTFEVGNETWNRLFAPWTFVAMRDAGTGRKLSRGTVYGLYQEYVLGVMRQSPYWEALAPKFTSVLGGWNQVKSYGADAALASPSSDILTIASYIGGWDEKEGPVHPTAPSFASVLSHTTQSGVPAARRLGTESIRINQSRTSGRGIELGTYEAGPGYVLNGLNGSRVTPEEVAAQELVMKSHAAGTATLDSFLTRAALGFKIQNYFTYGSGGYWKSHAQWEKGGQSYPSWILLSLFNTELTGDMLAVDTVQAPTRDLAVFLNRPFVQDAPQVALYATRKDDRLSVIAVSRRVPDYPVSGDDGRSTVRVTLPITGARSLTRYALSGPYDAHNVDADGVRLETTAEPLPANPGVLEIPLLPPGTSVIYVFDGITQ
jgi:hypothetical protein